MKKKVALGAAAVALVGTLAVGGTLAWFTDTETATNVVTMGEVDIALYEDGTPSNGQDGGVTSNEGLSYSDIVPGDVLAKKITIKNLEQPAYVRAKITISGSEKVLKALEDSDSTSNILIDGTTTTWSKNADGTYTATLTYSDSDSDNIMDKNEEWTVLSKFTIPTSWGNEFVKENFNIKVVAEAIQAEHNATEPWNEFNKINSPDLKDTTGKDSYDAHGTATPSQLNP